ncbi:MAG: MBL fold metallo-hydrolase [Acholeplasmataceae bacterium]|nr:MBL fold metallo-hydrolase [Acholeplasmataceae bacterium]
MEIKKFSLGNLRSNCYIVYENKKAFVVDPGYENDEIVPFLKTNDLKLEGIYLTHGHPDHVGGVKQLKDIYHCPVYAPKKDEIWLSLSPYNQIGYEIPVDVWMNDLDQIIFLDKEFTVYETPGHSEGGTILSYHHILFTGDTLFFQSIGRTDIPFANQQKIYSSIKRIYELFDDVVVIYPGHGRSSTIGHEKKFNPFVRQ